MLPVKQCRIVAQFFMLASASIPLHDLSVLILFGLSREVCAT